jgi:regulator of protease activity HflC (stomatin/prohibitin superfamily)
MVPVITGGHSDVQSIGRINVVAMLLLVACIAIGVAATVATSNPFPLIGMTIVGVILMLSPRIAKQWERAVVLRLGRFTGLQGPGLFWVVPLIDRVTVWIDQRTITTSFAAEQTLRGRERIEAELQQLIDQRSNPWGVTVSSVEMRDVVIPGALQDAMSREAQAAREKAARVILGQAEMEIAHSFEEAAKSYQNNPTALHLRAMNMLYEGLKEKGALMLIPSSAVESMGMGGMLGAAALNQERLVSPKEQKTDEKE